MFLQPIGRNRMPQVITMWRTDFLHVHVCIGQLELPVATQLGLRKALGIFQEGLQHYV